jgi:predicted RNase H-like HicB family nuclease
MEFQALIHEEDGKYWAEVRELPGCFASGKDLDELSEALIEAINMCITPADRRQFQGRSEGDQSMRIGAITVATAPLVPA